MNIHVIPSAFSSAECDQIITATQTVPAAEARLIGHNRDHNLRRADVVWLDDIDGLDWVMDRLIHLVRDTNRDRFDFHLTEFAESPQVAHYRGTVGGHFSWHLDIGAGPVAARRKLTLVAQLSDDEDYEGGDLEIMPGAQAIRADRTRGSVTLFPSFLLHRVTEVSRGERSSLTVWAHGPAFR